MYEQGSLALLGILRDAFVDSWQERLELKFFEHRQTLVQCFMPVTTIFFVFGGNLELILIFYSSKI